MSDKPVRRKYVRHEIAGDMWHDVECASHVSVRAVCGVIVCREACMLMDDLQEVMSTKPDGSGPKQCPTCEAARAAIAAE